ARRRPHQIVRWVRETVVIVATSPRERGVRGTAGDRRGEDSPGRLGGHLLPLPPSTLLRHSCSNCSGVHPRHFFKDSSCRWLSSASLGAPTRAGGWGFR